MGWSDENWRDFWASYFAMLAAVVTLFLIYKISGHDMIGLH